MERPPQTILSEVSSILQVTHLDVSAVFHGFSHAVFVLVSPSGQKHSLRIAKYEDASRLAQRGSGITKRITEMQPTLPIPAVIHVAESYAVLKYIDGDAITSWNTLALSTRRRHEILDGLAKFLFKLWTGVQPPTDDGDQMVSYRDWLLDEVDKAICRSIERPGWSDPISFFERRAMVDELVPPHNDLGPAIRHGDMNACNVLVNSAGFSGIIDWDTASFAPAPAAIQHPLFMAGVPGWRVDKVTTGMSFAEDREYLVAAIRRISSAEASNVADMLANSRERQFFELALRNKLIDKEFVKSKLDNQNFDAKAIIGQMHEFLSIHTEMKHHPAIAKLQKGLYAKRENQSK